MKSVVFGIGRELITAQTKDKNAYFVVSNLVNFGIDNRAVVFLDDKVEDIVDQIEFYKNRVEIIITIGGLGPTFDDLTIQAVSKAVNRHLLLNQKALDIIRDFYHNLYLQGKIEDDTLNENRKKMAYVPDGSILLKNTTGAACGIYLKQESLHIFCLPGVPTEMQPMFESNVVPIIKSFYTPSATKTQIFEYNINDESKLAFITKEVSIKTGVYLKTLPIGFNTNKMGVRFTSTGASHQAALDKIVKAKKLFEELLAGL